jgi:hypothetical protein
MEQICDRPHASMRIAETLSGFGPETAQQSDTTVP